MMRPSLTLLRRSVVPSFTSSSSSSLSGAHVLRPISSVSSLLAFHVPASSLASTTATTTAYRHFSSSTTAGSASSFAPINAATDETDAFLSVQVTDGKDGPKLVVRTPLPTITGVMHADFGADGTVADLFSAIQSRSDTPLGQLEIRDSTGRLYAASTRLGNVVDKSFVLVADGFRISALSRVSLPGFGEGGGAAGSADVTDEHPAYVSVKADLMAYKEPSTIADQLRSQLRQAAIAEGATASEVDSLTESWWRQLHQEGIILNFDASPDPSMRKVVFVKPYLLHNQLQKALDVRGSAVLEALQAKEEELDAATTLYDDMSKFKEDIVRRARSRVRVVAYGVGVFLVVQWGVIFHFVYEQSWDVMEPICYFIGTGYGILFYLFFMRTRQDPSAGNVFSWLFKSTQQSLHQRFGRDNIWKSASRFAEEKKRTRSHIVDIRQQIDALRAKLPPM